ncbi:MAG TPA: PDDEXK nuclease domain-containing protein [Candidatus Sulfotelmatobacter sp.]|nr:PDDEXK nuclease domain-containing protein [Candidatus Sulfotelmatobacter sp.]
MTNRIIMPENYDNIRTGIVELLKAARSATARNVNSIMTATYWEIGRRIVTLEQGGEHRAEYGEQIVEQLARDLTRQFGRGFGETNLKQMRTFYRAWPDSQIRQTLSDESATPNSINALGGNSSTISVLATRFALPWSAYVRLLSVKNSEARNFYEAEALRAGWSVRQLDRQIGSQFYERIALSKSKAAMLEKAQTPESSDAITPEEAIKDPFVLEFLDLKDEYSESDLEEALIRHLTDFLLELGDDFAFVGRQRRLRLDDNWFRVDLVFFHRRLRCLLLADLKIGKFSYTDAGQMHLYLNYAREHWMKPGENPPVGLILCAEKGAAEAHYALDNLPNKVLAAEYQTILPAEKLIATELEKSRRELEARKPLSTGLPCGADQ